MAKLTTNWQVSARGYPLPFSQPHGQVPPRHAGWNKRTSTARTNAESGAQPLPKWASVVFALITGSAVAALVMFIIIMRHSAFRDSTTSTTPPASAGSATHDGDRSPRASLALPHY
jgi:hypothetical protein